MLADGCTGTCTCTNTCEYANNGSCEDGAPGKDYSICELGTAEHPHVARDRVMFTGSGPCCRMHVHTKTKTKTAAAAAAAAAAVATMTMGWAIDVLFWSAQCAVMLLGTPAVRSCCSKRLLLLCCSCSTTKQFSALNIRLLYKRTCAHALQDKCIHRHTDTRKHVCRRS